MSDERRVLLTGATGFIGSHCISLLLDRGFQVHAVWSKKEECLYQDVIWHQADLLDPKQTIDLVENAKATHLLHLAWYVVPGKLITSIQNYEWVQSSLTLLREFAEKGGRRVVMSGSSYEYDWNYGYCTELVTPTTPNTFYGICKNALNSLVTPYAKEKGLSSAWPRIFFLYGPHEHRDRLVPAVISSLLKGEAACTSHGRQIRDYLYVKDVAAALVRILDSDIEGPINIGSGTPIALKEIIRTIGQKIGREDLIHLGAIPSRPNDTPFVLADNSRLSNELGWEPEYDLETGLEETIAWWKKVLDEQGR